MLSYLTISHSLELGVALDQNGFNVIHISSAAFPVHYNSKPDLIKYLLNVTNCLCRSLVKEALVLTSYHVRLANVYHTLRLLGHNLKSYLQFKPLQSIHSSWEPKG